MGKGALEGGVGAKEGGIGEVGEGSKERNSSPTREEGQGEMN